MPKNGFVIRFFGGAQLPVGVVGVQRSIQLSYDRTAVARQCRAGSKHYSKPAAKMQTKIALAPADVCAARRRRGGDGRQQRLLSVFGTLHHCFWGSFWQDFWCETIPFCGASWYNSRNRLLYILMPGGSPTRQLPLDVQ